MAPKLLQFIQKLFRNNWKQEYANTLTHQRKSNCVLKSVSSKSSLSSGSACSIAPRHACSMDSINFEFRTGINEADLCCVRKCCEKCFCEEGEALAANMRRKCRRKARREEMAKKILEKKRQSQCSCNNTGSSGSLDSACDVTSASSCEDADCRFRESGGSISVGTFAHIHATACSSTTEYDTLTPKYENVPEGKTVEESPYDFIPARPPRAVTEPRYENVLTVNCIDTCVFRQISSLMDSTPSQAQVCFLPFETSLL